MLRLQPLVERCNPSFGTATLWLVVQTGVGKKQMVSLVGHIGLYDWAGHISGLARLESIPEPNLGHLNPACEFPTNSVQGEATVVPGTN